MRLGSRRARGPFVVGMSSSPPRSIRTGPRRLLGVGLVLSGIVAGLGATPATSMAAACTPPVTNAVACENTLPGTPRSDWWVDNAGDETIQGFATSMSVNKGGTIGFKIKSATSNYHIDILRLGYYGGDGARKVASNLTPCLLYTSPSPRDRS